MRPSSAARRLLLVLAALVVGIDADAQDVKVTLLDGTTVSAPLERVTTSEVVLRGKLQPYPRTDVIAGTEAAGVAGRHATG